MGRSPCCEKVGLKKGPWIPEEDQKLMAYIEEFGHGSWRALPAKAGLQRCGKSCRLRWTNYLRPDIKRGKFSLQEEQTIIQLHALLGNRWSAIAAQLAKRTDNEIKNYWNTHLKKRLTRMGIDPTTHKPKTDTHGGSSCQSKDVANLSHIAQWESVRLEAEARLVRESKLQEVQNNNNKVASQPARLVLNKITSQQPSLPPCLDVLKAWQRSWLKPLEAPSKDNIRKMRSMYAMMLSTDDSNLESPTSTLCFPGTLPPLTTTVATNTANATNNSNNVGSSLFSENLLPLPTATGSGGFVKGAGSTDNMNGMLNLQDDDIMVAVEAFRSYDNNKNVVLEGLNNEEALLFDSINGDGSICNVNLEENKHYWNNLLNLVNDVALSGSSVF